MEYLALKRLGSSIRLGLRTDLALLFKEPEFQVLGRGEQDSVIHRSSRTIQNGRHGKTDGYTKANSRLGTIECDRWGEMESVIAGFPRLRDGHSVGMQRVDRVYNGVFVTRDNGIRHDGR